MRTYTITWVEETVYKTHIEAENEEEALEYVFQGKAIEINHEVELLKVEHS